MNRLAFLRSMAFAVMSLFTSAIIMFLLGFHNIDLAFNFLNLGYTSDCGLSGCDSLINYYLIGMGQLVLSFFAFIVSTFILIFTEWEE